ASDNRVTAVAFAPAAPFIISGTQNGIINIHNIDSGDLIASIEAHSGSVWSIALPGIGDFFATAGSDHYIKIWSLSQLLTSDDSSANGRTDPLTTLAAHVDSVGHLTFSRDSTMLASGSLDGTLRLWESITWQPLATLDAQGERIRALGFTADSQSLLMAGLKGTIHKWKLPPGMHLARPYLNAHRSS